MKKILTFAAFAVLALTSCSKEPLEVIVSDEPSDYDKDEMVNDNQLVGTWRGVSGTDYSLELVFEENNVTYTLGYDPEEGSLAAEYDEEVEAEFDLIYTEQEIRLAISKKEKDYKDRDLDDVVTRNTSAIIPIAKLNDKIVFEVNGMTFTCAKQVY